MEENETFNLDLEFRRYLQILKPYIAQLIDTHIISICNAWVDKLSQSEENKKVRNKYMFTLCVQLARGTLEDPFTAYPPEGKLSQVTESIVSDDSSTEVECYVVNAEAPRTEILFHSKQETLTDTEYNSQNNGHVKTASQGYDSDAKSSQTHSNLDEKQDFVSYTCPKALRDFINYDSSDAYEHRANNLIRKLRDMKTQNMLLHSELLALKDVSAGQHNYVEECATKMDCATSVILQSNASNNTLNSLKFRLQELQDSRINYIEKISSLQEVINNFNEMKNREIDEIRAKHKLEMINAKETIRHEATTNYEQKIEQLKMEYESKIDSLKNKTCSEIEVLSTSKNDVIEDKNKIIKAKDNEITKLNDQIEDLKSHLHTVLEKFIDKPPVCNHNQDEGLKYKAEQLEKRLNRVEKNKAKCSRVYEAKVAQLQRDKHLAECSLQLQMVRQRTQVVNEVTDENQTELTTALDKLETKYKEIVANMQATAIQRRMQDQIALESILQAACGIPNENNNPPGNGQFSKTMRSQTSKFDSGISPLSQANKAGNICIGDQSFTEDSVVAGYCLNRKKMGELFERVYVPQRDNTGSMK